MCRNVDFHMAQTVMSRLIFSICIPEFKQWNCNSSADSDNSSVDSNNSFFYLIYYFCSCSPTSLLTIVVIGHCCQTNRRISLQYFSHTCRCISHSISVAADCISNPLSLTAAPCTACPGRKHDGTNCVLRKFFLRCISNSTI